MGKGWEKVGKIKVLGESLESRLLVVLGVGWCVRATLFVRSYTFFTDECFFLVATACSDFDESF